jgi:hypothetical protein
VKLTEARANLAALLTDATPPEVSVYQHLPDQLNIPAILIGWADAPWLEPAGLCGDFTARAEVVLVAGRVEVKSQSDRLDELAAATILALAADTEWDGPSAPTSPYALVIAGVNYLAASLITSAVVAVT